MKQVINITLGGIVFAIEQDAYDALRAYLESIKKRLQVTDDYEEISADLETAIAEKFIARKKNEKMAVTIADVDAVTKEMGSPAEFTEEAQGESASESTAESATHSSVKKRLYRDTDDAIIAGVASGLAQYFGIDPVIVRLIFVVSIFFNGLGILAYIILWLVVPEAETTEQKYAMRGEQVTLKEITDRVKKNLNDVDTDTFKRGAQNTWGGLRPFLVSLFEVLGTIVKIFIHILRYIVGIALVLAGALTIAGLVTAYIVILFSEQVYFPYDVQIALDVLTGSTLGIIALLSSFVMMLIPLQLIILAGASLIAKENYFKVKRTVLLLVVWLVATVVAFSTSALQVEQVMQKVGPVEGRFSDDSFEILWQDGSMKGNKEEVFIRYRGSDGTNVETSLPSIPDVPNGPLVEIYDGITRGSNASELDLSGRGLTGSLKAEIRHMSELRELDISNNAFTGLPAEVGQLSKLEVLDLSDNQFTGLPHELGNLQNLRVLDLRGNDISAFDFDVIQDALPESTEIKI